MEVQVISNVSEKETMVLEETMTLAEARGVISALLDLQDNEEVGISYMGKALTDDEEPLVALIRKIDGSQSPTTRKLFCRIEKGTGEWSAEALKANLPSSEKQKVEDSEQRIQAKQMEPIIDMIANNPAFTEMMLARQPDLQEAIKKTPELGRILRDPATLKEILLTQIDPDRRREAGLALQSQLARIHAIPGGGLMLDRYTSDLLTDTDTAPLGDQDDLYAVPEDEAKPKGNMETNNTTLRNVWNTPETSSSPPNPFGMFPPAPNYNMPSLFGQSGPPRPPAVDAAVQYASQLQLLKEMGFEDESKCLLLLQQYNGDVEAVVDHFARQSEN